MIDKAIICNDYKLAKDKNKQIKILAELHACSVEKITEILSKEGLISGIPGAKKKRAPGVNWAIMDAEVSKLSKEGLSLAEIAERLGINKQAIYDRRKRLKASFDKNSCASSQGNKKKASSETIKKQCFDAPNPRQIINHLTASGHEITRAVVDLLTDKFFIISKKEGYEYYFSIQKEKTVCESAQNGQ